MASEPAARAKDFDRGLQATPPGDCANEGVLVERIRAGDQAAFTWVFDAHYRPLCLYVLGHIGQPAVAEEIVQDLFANLWAQRRALYLRGDLRSYLFGAARNRAYNWSRDQHVVRRWAARAVEDQGLAGAGQGPRPPDVQTHDHELTAALEKAVARLSPRQREAFTLRWAGHSCPDIGRLMGISTKTVENMLTRAYRALREDLARFY